VALVAKSEFESGPESSSQLKDKVHSLSKVKIEKLLFNSMDENDEINVENCMLKDVCSKSKKDVRILEKDKQTGTCERNPQM